MKQVTGKITTFYSKCETKKTGATFTGVSLIGTECFILKGRDESTALLLETLDDKHLLIGALKYPPRYGDMCEVKLGDGSPLLVYTYHGYLQLVVGQVVAYIDDADVSKLVDILALSC